MSFDSVGKEGPVPDTNLKFVPGYMRTSEASQITGLSHKELIRLGRQGSLAMYQRGPRQIYFRTPQIIALAEDLGRKHVRPEMSGYKTADEAAAYLGVHRETVRRMVKDRRLAAPKIVRGRPYYSEGNLKEALRILNYSRCMTVSEISEYTGLPEWAVRVMVGNNMLTRPNRDGRCNRGAVIDWWDLWLSRQAPFRDETRNQRLREYMAVVAAAEDRERTLKFQRLKRESEQRARLRQASSRA